MTRRLRAARALLAITLVLAHGCAFFTLKDELREMDRVRVITGDILGRTRPDGNVLIVLLQQTAAGLKVHHAAILNSPVGEYVVEAPVGVFYLTAFEDLDNDLAWDGKEPLGYYGRPDAITISKTSPPTVRGLDIALSAAPAVLPQGFPKLTVSPDQLGESIIKIGQVAGWDDPLFAPEYGVKGYWEPLTFLREVGFCLFFREAYDPSKIPVVFVHGALGTPLGWRDAVERLDPARVQPWLYYYPSGIPLDQSSRALTWMVMQLQERYRFRELYVVAHSMGGLVARSFIQQTAYEMGADFVRRFVSISTPWNGHKLTAKGVQQAPTAVPSWRDMVPDSPFISALFRQRLPATVTYDLLFSYRGNCSMFLENNDGTVELASELDPRAQREAERIYGYDEDHGSILTSAPALAQIDQLFRSRIVMAPLTP